jgi:hypothetical protein
MSRAHVQGVSILPSLLPCKIGEEDGFVNGGPVRIVTTDEVLAGYQKWRKGPRSLGKDQVDWRTLGGLSLLQRATETKDLTAGRAAAKMLEPFLNRTLKLGPGGVLVMPAKGLDYSGFLTLDKNPQLAQVIRDVVAYEAMGEQWYLPCFATAAVKGSSPVWWMRGKSRKHVIPFNPPQQGMLCPTYEAAIAFRMLFNGLRICLRCQSLFRQERPNQGCCTIECREAHRVARWRERKKAEAAQKAKGKRGGRR